MASKKLFTNKARTTLSAILNPADPVLYVAVGTGALFPSPGAGESFQVVVVSADGLTYEILTCTSRTGDALTVTHAQEGTISAIFAAGSRVGLRPTRATMELFPQRDAAENITGPWTHTGAVIHNGAVTTNSTVSHTAAVEATAASNRRATSIDQGAVNYAVASGTDTYTATLGLTALATGAEYRLKLNANTVTGCTINIDTLGVKSIKRSNGDAVNVGDISGEHTLRYNGVDMILVNPRKLPVDSDVGQINVTDPIPHDATSHRATSVNWVRWLKEIASDDALRTYSVLKMGGTNFPQNTTRYFGSIGVPFSATEYPTTITARVKRIRIYLSAAVAVGQTLTVTLRKDGADTSASTTFVAGDQEKIINCDIPYEGQLFSIKGVTSASFGSTTHVSASVMLYELYAPTVSASYSFVNGTSYTPANDPGYCYFGEGQGQTIESGTQTAYYTTAQLPLALNCRPTSAASGYPTGAGVTAFSGSTLKDAVAMSAVNLTDTTSWPAMSTAGFLRIATGGGGFVCYVQGSAGYAPGNVPQRYLGFTGKTFLAFTITAQAQNTTRYAGAYLTSSLASTEAEAYFIVPENGYIHTLCVITDANLPASNSAIFTVRKNSVDQTLTATVAAGTNTASDTNAAHAVAVVAGDKITVSSVLSATSGTRSANLSLLYSANAPT